MQLSQAAVARRLQLDSTRITAAELGRVPVKFSFGDRFASAYNVNQKWLAEGVGNATPYVTFSLDFAKDLPQNDTFLSVWNERLRLTYLDAEKGELLDLLAYLGKDPVLLPPDYASSDLLVGLTARIRAKMNSLPSLHKWKLFRALHETITGYETRPSASAFLEASQRLLLTDTKHAEKTERVRSMAMLRAELRRWTTAPGKKTELAAAIHLPLSTVSRYLSGKIEPGGEATLRLLDWVQQQRDLQQNTAASAMNTDSGKATQRKAVHETDQSKDRKR